MYMNAMILDAQVSNFHNAVEANIYDIDEKETYKVQIAYGLEGLAELRKLKKDGASTGVLEEAAAQVEMPPLVQPVQVIVRKVSVNKGFMKMTCEMVQDQNQ